MAVEADHSFAPLAPATASAERERALRSAHRHTRLVRILRIVLPVGALAIMAFYFLSSNFTISIGDMEASVSRIEINKDRLRMIDPRLEGVTGKKGSYVVTADYAEQEIANPSIVHLSAVRAEVDNATQGWTRLTSPAGVFDTTKEFLVLSGDIKVGTSSGMTSRLTRADIDMKTQTIVSPEPVEVNFPTGTLVSNKMHINMSAREVTFREDVRVRTEPPAKKPNAQSGTAAKPSMMSFSSTEPIDIAAPQLKILDAVKLAHFTGGVTTDQAGSRMVSREMKLYYEKKAGDQEAGQGGTKLRQIEAIGDVLVVAADGRRAASQKLTYDAGKQQLTLDQDVTLTQAENTLKAPRLITDLATGITRFPPPGRVKGHFAPRTPDKEEPRASPAAATGASQLDLSSTRGQPIDIEANSLIVDDRKKTATFDGDVQTEQGGMKLRSRSLRLYYGGETGAQGKGTQITQVRAQGPVVITTAKKQTVTSDWALFESTKQTVTIGGNVVLSEGGNVIKGDKLVVDLKTGRSRFENNSSVESGKRVQGLFMPRQFKKKETEKAPAQ